MLRAAAPWEEDRSRRGPHETQGGGGGSGVSLGDILQGGGEDAAVSRPREEERAGNGNAYFAEPQAASWASRVIIVRLMPRSSRSRVVRAFSSRTVWRYTARRARLS